MAAFFITEQYIKDTTLVDENVDAKYIRVAILEAQDIHLQPIIGSTLYSELKTQITANTVTSDNQTLLNTYIAPCLKYWALFEIVDVMLYKFNNKNIAKKNSENAQPIEVSEASRLKNIFGDKAEFYSKMLRDYLMENSTTYTSYHSPDSGIDVIHPNKGVQYKTGLYLGNSKPPNWYDKYERGICE